MFKFGRKGDNTRHTATTLEQLSTIYVGSRLYGFAGFVAWTMGHVFFPNTNRRRLVWPSLAGQCLR